jgi:hypothetical protein
MKLAQLSPLSWVVVVVVVDDANNSTLFVVLLLNRSPLSNQLLALLAGAGKDNMYKYNAKQLKLTVLDLMFLFPR